MKISAFLRTAGLTLSFLVFTVSFAFAEVKSRPPIFGEGFGIDVKIERITEPEIEKIAGLGIRDVRSGLRWEWVEKRQGDYEWDRPLPRDSAADGFSETRSFTYDEQIERMHRHGLHMTMILGGGNALHAGPPVRITGDNGDYTLAPAPRTPEAIDAFAAFAAETAKHYSSLYGPEAIDWIIWNEPNFDPFFPPKADGVIAGRLVETACRRIKEAVPKARVMGPALATLGGGRFDYDFVKAMFTDANPLTCLDAFTLHPYRPAPPETAPADYAKMAALLAKWQPAVPVPIAVDEWGIHASPTGMDQPQKRWRDSSLEEQAALQFRIYLTNLAAGIPYTALYEWRDSGANPDDPEDNYGMNTFTNEEKPAIQMLRAVWPRLSGRVLFKEKQPGTCNDRVHLLRFAATAAKEPDILVAWTDRKSDGLHLKGTFGPAQTIFGQAVLADQKGQTATLPLGGIPLLIDLPGKSKTAFVCSLLAQ